MLADATLDAPTKAIADEFVERVALTDAAGASPPDLDDESAVLAAFAETAGDPEHPPVGVVVFVGGASTGLGRRADESPRLGVVDLDRCSCGRRHAGTADRHGCGWSPGADFPFTTTSRVSCDGRLEGSGAGPRASSIRTCAPPCSIWISRKIGLAALAAELA